MTNEREKVGRYADECRLGVDSTDPRSFYERDELEFAPSRRKVCDGPFWPIRGDRR